MRIEKSKRHRGDQIEILSTGHSFKQVPYPGLACFQRRLPRKKKKLFTLSLIVLVEVFVICKAAKASMTLKKAQFLGCSIRYPVLINQVIAMSHIVADWGDAFYSLVRSKCRSSCYYYTYGTRKWKKGINPLHWQP